MLRTPTGRLARFLAAPAVLLLSSGLVASTTTPAIAAGGDDATVVQGERASAWLTTQLSDGRIHNGQFDFDDWGLTIDTYWAMVAAGNRPQAADKVIRTVSANAYASYVQFDGDFFAGAVAKTLLARRVAGLSASVAGDGGPFDLRAQLLSMRKASGRLSDDGTTDYSSTLTQALGVTALSRSGGVPQKVIDYLAAQQCDAGFFRQGLGAGGCDDDTDTAYLDSTAFAVQALAAARAAGAEVPSGAIGSARDYLVSAQAANGGWSADGSDTDVNANTTGLVVQALEVGVQTATVDDAQADAAAWTSLLRVTAQRAGDGPAARDTGAIARTRAALQTALADGITQTTRDSFRRATAQAVYAFVPVPLGRLSA